MQKVALIQKENGVHVGKEEGGSHSLLSNRVLYSTVVDWPELQVRVQCCIEATLNFLQQAFFLHHGLLLDHLFSAAFVLFLPRNKK